MKRPLVAWCGLALILGLATACGGAADAPAEPEPAFPADVQADAGGDQAPRVPQEPDVPSPDAELEPPPPPVVQLDSLADFVFEDVALAWNAQDHDARNRGVVPGDFNGDGHLDLFLANPTGGSRILYGTADGPFEVSDDLDLPPYPVAGLAVDFDGDGDQDLLVTCGGWSGLSYNTLLRNDGPAPPPAGSDVARTTFTDVGAASHLSVALGRFFGAAAGDLDGDGDLDLYVSNKQASSGAGGPPAKAVDLLYEQTDPLRFEPRALGPWAAVEGHSHQPIMADFDGDGRLDLFAPSWSGESAILLNEGGFQFQPRALAVERPFAACAADFNRDGALDLFVASRTDPGQSGTDHVLYLGDGAGGLEDVAALAGLTGPDHHGLSMGLACGDLDADGLLEILVGTGEPATGALDRLYRTTRLEPGASPLLGLDVPVFEDVTPLLDFPAPAPRERDVPLPSYPYRTHGVTFWDFDHDGRLDIFVGNGGMGFVPRIGQVESREPNRLFRHAGALGDGWLEIVLKGRAPNTQGIGARIQVSPGGCADGFSSAPRTYLVLAGNAFNGHPPLWTRAGFVGCASAAVTVRWPGGVEESYGSFAGAARVTLEETSP